MSPSEGNVSPALEIASSHGGSPMIYEYPIIRVLDSVGHFFDRVSQRISPVPGHPDWRAMKITDFIDNHPGKVVCNLDNVCKQLGLALSGRQARRVFRRAMRIGFKEYLKKSRLAFAAEQLKKTTTVPIKAIEESEENFDTEVQLSASMHCPQAASPPSGAPPECVSDCAEQLDVSARSSAHQMAHRQGPAEKRHALALVCGGRILGNLCLSARLFRACGCGEFPDRPESRFPYSA